MLIKDTFIYIIISVMHHNTNRIKHIRPYLRREKDSLCTLRGKQQQQLHPSMALPEQRAVLYLTIINDVCITLWVILTLLRQTKCIYRDILLIINVFCFFLVDVSAWSMFRPGRCGRRLPLRPQIGEGGVGCFFSTKLSYRMSI